jgi:hypothetical protein
MAEYAVWRDFEQRFLALKADCDDSLQATWIEDGSGASQWYLRGSTESARKLFIWVAERAAVELGHKAGTSWTYFLDLLKRDSPNHRQMTLQNFDHNGGGVKTGAGTILRVCGAAAQYCIRCESYMISKRRRKADAEITPAGVTPTDSLVLGVSNAREKPGAKSDVARASRISEIIARMAPGRSWRAHWEETCEDFDAAQIPVSRAWKKKGLRKWSDCEDRERAVKAIMYQLKLAKKKKIISLA